MRVSLGSVACTGTMADFFNLSCWGTNTTAPVIAGECVGGSPNLTPAQIADCNAANTRAAQALCVANPAACANYQAVTGNDATGQPTGNGTDWCYVAGLCNVDGSFSGISYALMLAAGFLFFEAVKR